MTDISGRGDLVAVACYMYQISFRVQPYFVTFHVFAVYSSRKMEQK